MSRHRGRGRLFVEDTPMTEPTSKARIAEDVLFVVEDMPDWVCEILSPTTRRHDMLRKLPYYAKVGAPWSTSRWMLHVLTAGPADGAIVNP
jgi:Uma2 family endonuclease